MLAIIIAVRQCQGIVVLLFLSDSQLQAKSRQRQSGGGWATSALTFVSSSGEWETPPTPQGCCEVSWHMCKSACT